MGKSAGPVVLLQLQEGQHRSGYACIVCWCCEGVSACALALVHVVTIATRDTLKEQITI